MPLGTRLIEDLVPIILDTTDWYGAPSNLLNFALVSPAWLWPVRHRLYKHPTITSENQCRYLVRTLQSLPNLQPLVFGLNLWLEDPPFLARGIGAVRFVLSLHNLQHLSFLSPTATFLMHRIQNHAAIRRLAIMPENHPVPVRTAPSSHSLVEWEPKLASKFTSLTKLVLFGSSLHITKPQDDTLYPFHLTDLTISQCIITYGDIFRLMDPVAWSSIRNLTLIIIPHPWHLEISNAISRVLSQCEDSLVRLYIQYHPVSDITGALAAGRIFDVAMRGTAHLRALRSLHLVDVGPQFQRSSALRDIGVRCPGLTDLTISGYLAEHMLSEWGWPSDTINAFPALTTMRGPAHVLAPNGLWQSSTQLWEAHTADPTSLHNIQWKVIAAD